MIRVTTYLLYKQICTLEEEFLKNGGLRERMTQARLASRKQFGGPRCSSFMDFDDPSNQVCPEGYQILTQVFENNSSHPLQRKATVQAIDDFINEATGNGFGIFSNYAFGSKKFTVTNIEYKVIGPYAEFKPGNSAKETVTLVICKQTAVELAKQTLEFGKKAVSGLMSSVI